MWPERCQTWPDISAAGGFNIIGLEGYLCFESTTCGPETSKYSPSSTKLGPLSAEFGLESANVQGWAEFGEACPDFGQTLQHRAWYRPRLARNLPNSARNRRISARARPSAPIRPSSTNFGLESANFGFDRSVSNWPARGRSSQFWAASPGFGPASADLGIILANFGQPFRDFDPCVCPRCGAKLGSGSATCARTRLNLGWTWPKLARNWASIRDMLFSRCRPKMVGLLSNLARARPNSRVFGSVLLGLGQSWRRQRCSTSTS